MRKKCFPLVLALALCLGLSSPTAAFSTGTANQTTGFGVGQNQTGWVDADGSLWMWGDNSSGELGNGGTGNTQGFGGFCQTVPVKVMSDVSFVSSGDNHTAALKTDGSLWLWGANLYGQLGKDGAANFGDSNGRPCQSIPIKVLDDVASVSCGSNHTAAIKTDGSLWMWGYNVSGQLGNGFDGTFNGLSDVCQPTPIKVMDDVASVSCGRSHTAAIKTDGSLWMWGSNGNGELGNGGAGNVDQDSLGKLQTVPVKIMDGVTAVSCGDSHTAAVKTDGSLWTWGSSESNESVFAFSLSDKIFGGATPIKVMSDAAFVSCGSSHIAALKSDGSAWVWGNNEYGQLGIGTVESAVTPVRLTDGAVGVACGGSNTFLVKSDASILGCGINNSGQLGNNGAHNRVVESYNISVQTVPTQISGLTAKTQLPKQPAQSAFTDVTADAYYADAVKWAVEKEITTGTTATTFAPNTTCTTGQILTFLWRANGSPAPTPTTANPFTDVKESDYYYKAALWAAEKGMVSGTALGASTPCTRSATVTYLWKLAGEPSATKEAAFSDVPSGADYAKAVAWAVARGITSGTSATTFAPDTTCTRGQIVTFLYRDMAQ